MGGSRTGRWTTGGCQSYCTRLCDVVITYILLSCPFYRWGNWGTGSLNHLCNASHSLVVEPRSESRQFAVRVHFFNQYQYFISFDCDPQEKKKISFHIMTQHAHHRPKPKVPLDTFIHIVCTSFGYFLFPFIGKINANCDAPNCFPVPLAAWNILLLRCFVSAET